MKILAFSDWRTQPLDAVLNIIEKHKPDVILYAGDDLSRFIGIDDFLFLRMGDSLVKLTYRELESIPDKDYEILTHCPKNSIKKIKINEKYFFHKWGVPVYYVNGNDDEILKYGNNFYIELEGIMENNRICFNHNILLPINPSFGKFSIRKNNEKISVFGFESQFGNRSNIKNAPTKYADIYLTHLPPLGTLDLSVRFGMNHIGSKKLRDLVEKYQPKLVICGHSHLWGGHLTKIGDTIVVNVSSHDREYSSGNYALIDTKDWTVELKTMTVETLHYVRGLGTIYDKLKNVDSKTKKNMKKSGIDVDVIFEKFNPWNSHGFETQEDLCRALDIVERLGVDTKKVRERIESVNWEKPKIARKITINPDLHAFVDVETGISKGINNPGKLWLIGIWYDGELKQFLFPEERKEFLAYLKKHHISSLVSWTQYDMFALRKIIKRRKRPIKYIDACQRVSNCVVWHTYKLDELYRAMFGNTVDDKDSISGYIAGLYADHLLFSDESCPYCPAKEEIMEKIKAKNKRDIIQMVEICRKLWDFES